jgi:hypothetical protein
VSLGSKSLHPATAWERKRIEVCKDCGCVICRHQGTWACSLPIEYHHILVGGLRAGHRYGLALCIYHHQGRAKPGYTKAKMREEFGPNLRDESKAFHALHGSDQELLDKQDQLIGYMPTTIPQRAERNKKSRCTRPDKMIDRGQRIV